MSIRDDFLEAESVLTRFLADESCMMAVEEAGRRMVDTLQNGGKIMSCGNGGSMCDAMHFAEELTGRFRSNRRPLPAMAIADGSYISCVANDFGYQHIFSRCIEALGNHNDTLLAISTSGNSQNVAAAITAAKNKGMTTILLSGNSGGSIKKLADIAIIVPHTGFSDRIQEIHIKIIHALIHFIEENLN